jgi:hypothetical protein
MIDLDENRLAVAKRFDATSTINADSGSPVDAVVRLTGGFPQFQVMRNGQNTKHNHCT